jgi:hypothetical protein
MKTKLIRIVVIAIALASCDSIKRTVRESYQYEMYIDFKNISFQGQNSTQRLYLEIDSTKGMWYDGKLIINNRDTLMIHGFEKGSHYVTTYKIPQTDKYGALEIWCRGERGQIRDSLTIADRNPASGIVKEKTVLYRQARITCH